MPTYLYTAKTKKGENKAGTLEAINKHKLAAILRQQDLVLISAETTAPEEKVGRFDLKDFLQRIGRISLVEKMVFSRHLSIMIKAGLSLNQALRVLAEQTKNPKFKKIIGRLEEDVRRGQPLSDCLAKEPKVFNELYINMVRVGETSGNLDKVLKILAEQMRKDHELISRVRGAMMYPAVIITVMTGIGILMMIMVVPKLTEVFTEFNMELPLSTQIIIGLSNFLKNHLFLGLIILIGLIVLLRFGLKNKKVKRVLDKIYLHLPILGSLVQKINSARFARTLSSLVDSGLAIVKALQIVAGTLGNIHFKEALINSASQVQKGRELSQALSSYKNLYPPMVIQMIHVGEQTGSLSDILKNLADFYEEEIDNTTKNLSSIMEPVIMVIIGAAVGFFAVSMIQPMYSMMGGL
ncbi:MAG: type II secretion system F family protein [Candidatus Portnoybacteria bacterium]|nr:type II secretion system F family protein [Candidatus Portnoybacteria bacterium]